MRTSDVSRTAEPASGLSRLARVVAWPSVGLVVVLAAVQWTLQFRTRAVPIDVYGLRGFDPIFGVFFAVAGAMIATRRSDNPVGWLFLLAGVVSSLQGFVAEYAVLSFVEHRRSLPLTDLFAWAQSWMWIPVVGVVGVYVPLLFPDGRPLSPRWGAVALAAPIPLTAFGVAISLYPGQLEELPRGFENPFAISQATADALVALSGPAFVLTSAAAVAALVLRYRRSAGEVREQLKWLVFAGVFVVLAMLLNISQAIQGLERSRVFTAVEVLTLLSVVGVSVATAIAVLKHRLYDIDVVINKTVVFGILAAFITLVYVAVVVGIGALIGSGDEPNVGLSILATAIVAVAFQPLRERSRRLANRLVYGERATPYELLAAFSGRLSGAYAVEEVLPRMARMICEGMGARRAVIWLHVGEAMVRSAEWPPGSGSGEPDRVPAVAQDLPALPEAREGGRALSVRHQGELLGALGVVKPPGDPVTPAEEKLLSDLASQAGLVLRNVRLTEELRAKLEELRASRQRLVAAQDVERRRLERNIHDGAQQHLVALGVQLGLLRTVAARDPSAIPPLVDRLQDAAQEALESLRDLARGIYPPLLADHGLRDALAAQIRKVPIPVSLEAEGVGRYRQDVEAAVYFCCLEALQNVAKYAGASSVAIRLSPRDGHLRFEVSDDGAGFDSRETSWGMGLQNMADRLSALGGSLEIRSAPGRGTTVEGRIPVRGGPSAAS